MMKHLCVGGSSFASMDLFLLYRRFFWKFGCHKCKCQKQEARLPYRSNKLLRDLLSLSLFLSLLRSLFSLSSVSRPTRLLPKLCVNHSQTKHRQQSRPARHASTNRERKGFQTQHATYSTAKFFTLDNSLMTA